MWQAPRGHMLARAKAKAAEVAKLAEEKARRTPWLTCTLVSLLLTSRASPPPPQLASRGTAREVRVQRTRLGRRAGCVQRRRPELVLLVPYAPRPAVLLSSRLAGAFCSIPVFPDPNLQAGGLTLCGPVFLSHAGGYVSIC